MKTLENKVLTMLVLSILVLSVFSALAFLPTSAQVGETATTAFQLPTDTGTILPTNYGDVMQYNWPSSGQNSARDRFSAGPGPNDANILWQIPQSGSGTVTTWNGKAYYIQMFQSLSRSPLTPPYPPGGTVYCVDALTGQQIWNATEPLPTYIFYPAVDVVGGSVVMVTAATGLVGFDANTGQQLWVVDGIYPTLAPGAGRYFPSLFIPEENEVVVRADNMNGTSQYITAYDLSNPTQTPTIKWQYPYTEPTELMAYGDGVIFAGTSTWSAYGLNATTGELMWYQPIQEQLYFSGIYNNGIFYTGGSDRFLYAFNATTGDVIFQHDYGDFGFVAQGGAFGYGRYYTQFINYTGLYISAFDGLTGTELWSYGIPLYQGISQQYIQPAVADGKVWIYAFPGTYGAGTSAQPFLACFDAFTGALLYKIDNAGATPVISYGNLYMYGNGYVTAYGAAAQTTDWDHWRGPDGTGVANGVGPSSLNLRWKFTTGAAVTAPVIAAQGKVFVGSYDHNYYALDAYTGDLVWNFTTGYKIYSAPTYQNGLLYTGADDGNVYALNAGTGQVVWQTHITDKVDQVFGPGVQLRSSPIIDGSSLYLGSLDGNVYKLDLATGNIQWSTPTGGPIAGSPVHDNGQIFIGSTDRYIYAINEADGSVNWQYLTPRGTNQSLGLEVGFCATPVVAQGMVFSGVNYDYKASGTNYFVALNETTGALIWAEPEDNAIVGNYFEYNAPSYYDGVIYMPNGNRLAAFNATNGDVLSEVFIGHEPLSSYVMAVNQYRGGSGFSASLMPMPMLYFGTALYVEYAFNVTDPTNMIKTGFYTTAAQVPSTAAIYDGMLYVGSGDQNIYALGDYVQQPTIVAVGVDKTSVNTGSTITITGGLTGTQQTLPDGALEGGIGGIPNAPVTVSLRGPNGEAVDLNTTTDLTGAFTVSYTPTVAGDWNLMAEWNGYAFKAYAYNGAQSTPVSFTAKAPSTATPTPSAAPTETPTPTQTATPTPSAAPTETPTPTQTPSAAPTPESAGANVTLYVVIAAVIVILVVLTAAVALRRRK